MKNIALKITVFFSLLLLCSSCSKDDEVNLSTIEVAKINLTAKNSTLSVGESLQVKAVITPENASRLSVIWSSSNAEIASVDTNGLVTGHTPGKVSINATTSNPSQAAQSIELTVLNTTNSITSFNVEGTEGVIKGSDIVVTLPAASAVDLTNILPTIVHSGISTEPANNVAQDFTKPVTYAVIAQNGDKKQYQVTVNIPNAKEREALIELYKANPENTLNSWDIENPTSHISTWDGVTLDDNNNIIELELKRKNLTSIPESIGNLTKLSTLSLAQNQLTSMPNSITELVNLKGLDLYGNKFDNIVTLIDNLLSLSLLQSLDIGANKVTDIPESIGNLTPLKYLYFDQNQLTNIPSTIGDLSNLIELFIDSNKLTSVPESFGNLRNLQSLFLDSNQMNSIPKVLCDLENLQLVKDEGVICI
ncbi:Ig-like domain-containing protein [Aquimarina sp. W85]|uniref:leucine-rich repeat domain-containing protein n=1 Tax=Aquimarina rhodophyticola TaxID=3342246 RepID=UPI00366CC05B